MRLKRTRPSCQRSVVAIEEECLKPVQLFQSLCESPIIERIDEEMEEDEVSTYQPTRNKAESRPKAGGARVQKKESEDINTVEKIKEEEENLRKLQEYYDSVNNFTLLIEINGEPWMTNKDGQLEKYDAEKWQKKKDEERASYQKQIEESEVRLSALQKKGEHIATTKKEDSVTELNSEVENNVSKDETEFTVPLDVPKKTGKRASKEDKKPLSTLLFEDCAELSSNVSSFLPKKSLKLDASQKPERTSEEESGPIMEELKDSTSHTMAMEGDSSVHDHLPAEESSCQKEVLDGSLEQIEKDNRENLPQTDALSELRISRPSSSGLTNDERSTLLDYKSPLSRVLKNRSFNRLSELNFSPIGDFTLNKRSLESKNEHYFTSTPMRKNVLVPETPGTFTNSVLEEKNTTRNTTRIVSFYEKNSTIIRAKVPFYLDGYDGSLDDHFSQMLYTIHQVQPITWESLGLKTVKKLGEGVYGEVFSCDYYGRNAAIKVIPFNNNFYRYEGKVNGELLMEPQEILPEILITRELSLLESPGAPNSTPNFIKLLGAHVVKGKYPRSLINAWKSFNRDGKSENDDPSQYATANQHYVAICLSMGGIDLEHIQLENESQCISLLLQVALSLLIAEESIEFEHRDLHCGNVLVDSHQGDIQYRYREQDFSLVSHGVKANIIDFTLSRMKKDGTILYRDLENDEELFQGYGSYQFEIYRMMREANKFKELMATFDKLLEKESLVDFLSGEEFAHIISPYIRQ